MDALDELIQTGMITPQLAIKILLQVHLCDFDKTLQPLTYVLLSSTRQLQTRLPAILEQNVLPKAH